MHLIMHSFTNCYMHYKLWNIGFSPKIYCTRLRETIENEEMTHLESHYQKELESVKNEVARLTNLLEQLLKSKSEEGTSA